jgi:diacylglycerol kinase family enzyme
LFCGMNDFVFEFARAIAFICERSPLAGRRPLRWTVIANTAAGGFTIRKRVLAHAGGMEISLKKAASLPVCRAEPSQSARRAGNRFAAYGFCKTGAAGEAAMITKELLREAEAATRSETPDDNPLFLVISAGGDGTALEILREFHKQIEVTPKFHEAFVFLRLPMGTGNDGADTQSLRDALFCLLEPRGIRDASAIRLSVSTPWKGPFYAFNILSAGLDAFVTHWTNKMKGKLPGDSYKLWIDAASLFYNKIYRVGIMEARAYDREGNAAAMFREKALLLAVGASGRSSYGAGNRILPDDRNVCIMREMPVFRKIAMKGLVADGRHANCPEVLLFSAVLVKFISEYPILAQMDGETVLLQPQDFPAAIEVLPPLIPVLDTALC